MTFYPCRIQRESLDAFRPYLLAQVQDRVEDGSVYALGICTGTDLACGAAAFVLHPEGAELLSLFVDPAVRRRGCATQLVLTVKYIAAQLGVDHLFVQYTLPSPEEREALESFLRSMGFAPPEIFARRYRISAAELAKARYFSDRSPQRTEQLPIVPFCGLSEGQVQQISGMPEVPEVLRLERYRAALDDRVSHACIEDGVCAGYVLFVRDQGVYRLAAAYSDQHRRGIFLHLILACYEAFLRTAPASEIEISAISLRTERLCRELLQGAQYDTFCDYRADCWGIVEEIAFLSEETPETERSEEV